MAFIFYRQNTIRRKGKDYSKDRVLLKAFLERGKEECQWNAFALFLFVPRWNKSFENVNKKKKGAKKLNGGREGGMRKNKVP